MKTNLPSLAIAFAVALPAFVSVGAAPPPASSTAAAPASVPAAVPGLDVSSLDRSVDPCADFYKFTCGGWMANNSIPADRSRWGRSDELGERNLVVLRGILEQVKGPSPDGQRLGDFYASCLDEAGVEKAGLAPLKPMLDRINGLSDPQSLPELVAALHGAGVSAFFSFSSEPDMKNAAVMIAGTDQGGLGLPERDYYVRDDAKSVELRAKYEQHVATMFAAAGDKQEVAAAKAKVVMALETKLAKASLDMVARRDPKNLYHKMTVAELNALSPSFSFARYFAATTAPAIASLNVAVPDFVRGMQAALKETPLPDVKTYLTWHVLNASAPMLPARFVNADFEFFGKALTGAKELKPRWKRCVGYTDELIGEALGKIYVEQTFGAEGKQRTLGMVQAIEGALGADIDALPWMTAATKKQAREKLAAVTNKIGYPDKWRDYSALKVVRGDALGNFQRGIQFEVNRRLAKIDKPVDKSEWEMTPPTVNAYFHPLQNNINFPAGILQPPFFSNAADDALNYGGIGAVIGHELTHGFDDEGRNFDAAGNLRDWWSAADAKAFDDRAACFTKQYGDYVAVDDVRLNGKLTLGENVADNGGLRLALMALKATTGTKKVAPSDGFTQEQRIFLGWAQVWCQNITPEAARMRAQTDPHSPGRYRVNGVVANMPEFQAAFACKASAPMVRAEKCRVW